MLSGLKQLVEGSYEQSSPPPSNDWHYVSIRGQNGSENIFTWKNKAGVEWDLIFVEKENSGVFKFQVGKLFSRRGNVFGLRWGKTVPTTMSRTAILNVACSPTML